MPDSAARRKRNLYAVLAGVMTALLLIGTFMWGTAAAQRGEVSASNALTLAEQVKQACATGQLVIDDQNLCDKAEQVAASPAELVPGPPGPKGVDGQDGRPGIDGKDGAPGKDSMVPGPAGRDGTNGADSTVPGPAGQDGADSTVPGPAGRDGIDGAPGVSGPQGPQGVQGEPGTDGAPGAAPASFTFTDKTGTTYTCVPNPPGSATYTCSGDNNLPIGGTP
jgi:hypothetical protein